MSKDFYKILMAVSTILLMINLLFLDSIIIYVIVVASAIVELVYPGGNNMANITSESQLRAVRNYENRTLGKIKTDRYKRIAKTFTRNHATMEELAEYEELIEISRKELEKNK